MPSPVLVIGCGALGRELVALRRLNGWSHLSLRLLPAELHNRPERIAPALREAIEAGRRTHEHVFIAYADCGSRGEIDRVAAEYGVERLPGAHCYEFLAGSDAFRALAEEEPGTFYLTDFLVRHFDRLVRRGLGLDRHPGLMPQYFGNYRRLVYLSQSGDPALEARARDHARFLGLAYRHRTTGFAPFDRAVTEHVVQWRS